MGSSREPALDELLDALRRRDFTVIGPRVRSGSIVYDELASADELPAGRLDTTDIRDLLQANAEPPSGTRSPTAA